jgi:hypothetical protein
MIELASHVACAEPSCARSNRDSVQPFIAYIAKNNRRAAGDELQGVSLLAIKHRKETA